MGKEGNKPKWQKKVGNMHLALFKNKTKKGIPYVTWCITAYRYPFSAIRKFYLCETEVKSMLELLEQRPEIKKKEDMPE